MAFNAANRKDVRRAEKASRLAARDDADAIKKIMADSFGRAWMWRKLETAHIFSDPFTGDPLLEAYNKGYRAFGMVLLADIMLHCPDQYLTMTREANVRRINDDNGSNTSSDDSGTGQHTGSQDGDGGVEGYDTTADESDRDEADGDSRSQTVN
jgi:hypothetical protein